MKAAKDSVLRSSEASPDGAYFSEHVLGISPDGTPTPEMLRPELRPGEDQPDALLGRALMAEAKWREYERDYILPVFEWAKEVGFDLPAAVRKGGGNCVALLVRYLIERHSGASMPCGPHLTPKGSCTTCGAYWPSERRSEAASLITHVAVRFRDQIWSLPRPLRHHHVFAVINSYSNDVIGIDARGDDQGFLDASGRYLTRQQALVSAQLNNQIRHEDGIIGGVLTSEDLC